MQVAIASPGYRDTNWVKPPIVGHGLWGPDSHTSPFLRLRYPPSEGTSWDNRPKHQEIRATSAKTPCAKPSCKNVVRYMGIFLWTVWLISSFCARYVVFISRLLKSWKPAIRLLDLMQVKQGNTKQNQAMQRVKPQLSQSSSNWTFIWVLEKSKTTTKGQASLLRHVGSFRQADCQSRTKAVKQPSRELFPWDRIWVL